MDVIDRTIKYLEKKLDDSVQSWHDIPGIDEIPGIEKSVNRFRQALSNNERIYFVHDSDADGVGSAVLATHFMDDIQYKNKVHRITKRAEGYGFLPLHVDEALEEKASIIITTDNGITSKEGVAYATQQGIDVIITDHHQPDRFHYPDTEYIVNPQISSDFTKLKDVSGTVVFWYFMMAFKHYSSIDVDLQKHLEELTLTTISDVMPLQHVNRFLVKTGLEYFNNPRRPFTRIVKEKNVYDPEITAESIAFSLAPMINAANRFQMAEKAYNFLLSKTDIEAQQWYEYLTTLNEQRKYLTNDYIKSLENIPIQYGRFIYVNMSKEVEPGILGILAGKLAEQYGLPAVVTSTQQDGVSVKGSGRSVGQLDMLSVLRAIPQCKVGGHKQAFGVEFKYQDINSFVTNVYHSLNDMPDEVFKEPDESFMDINISDITEDLYNIIKQFEPFGAGFPKPIFGMNVEVVKSYKFGKLKNHTKFVLRDNNGDETEMVSFFEQRPFAPRTKIRINITIEFDSWTKSIVGRIKKIL